MIRLQYADQIPVWTADFRTDEKFARQCVAYVQTAAPKSHKNHITGVFVSKSGDSYCLRYEVVLDSGVVVPEVAITSLEPYQNEFLHKLKETEHATD